MKKNTVLERFTRLVGNLFLPKKQVLGLSPVPCKTGKPFLDAKIGLAQNSARPRYIKIRERAPVTAAKGHQLARTGKLHGVLKHPKN